MCIRDSRPLELYSTAQASGLGAPGHQVVTSEAWERFALALPAGLRARPVAAPTARPARPM
eukprot:13767729-Alexandrium_andersonii.AAC.1